MHILRWICWFAIGSCLSLASGNELSAWHDCLCEHVSHVQNNLINVFSCESCIAGLYA